MAGTVEGGEAAAKTNKSKYGSDFYGRIGAIGGRLSKGGGFTGNPEAARLAGAVGGKLSRRGPSQALKPTLSPQTKAARIKASQAKRTKPCSYCDRIGHTSYLCELRLAAIARNKVRQEEITDDYAKLSRIAARFAK